MLKKIFLFLLIFFFAFYKIAQAEALKPDSLLYTLQLNDKGIKEQRLVKYINIYFTPMPVDSINQAGASFSQLLSKYNVENKAAYDLYIESIYQDKKLNTTAAKSALLKAIDIAAASHDHFLWYMFLTHLAFIQTYEGNAIDAISSFREAKKEAAMLKDAYLQVVIDINISDIYYKYNFYSQSLDYLGQAWALLVDGNIKDHRLPNVIFYNKCENYFRMNRLDSLKKYNLMLENSKDKTYKLHTYINRTRYYIYLLKHDYKSAINLINSLPKDTLYRYDNLDRQNLADAYFKANMPDSAKHIIDNLVVDKALNNHPEIKYHLYEILGEINEKANDNKQAAINFKMALQESKTNISKLIQVGDISSRMKIEEVANVYIRQDEIYKRERLWLIFTIIVALLTVAVIAMFYRNAKQKRHYERLLFAAKREELSFINSHNIRKHLSNILGIIEAVKHSDNKQEEYQEMEERLFYSVEQLDESIKSISDKLSD